MSEIRTPIMTENIKLHFTSKTLCITKMEAQKTKKHKVQKKGGPKHHATKKMKRSTVEANLMMLN